MQYCVLSLLSGLVVLLYDGFVFHLNETRNAKRTKGGRDRQVLHNWANAD